MTRVGLLVGVALALSHSGCKKQQDNPRDKPGTKLPVDKPAETLTLRIAYGSEKKAWFEEAVAAFHSSKAKTPSGKVIKIETKPLGSGEAAQVILDGSFRAHVYSPAS